MRSLSTKIMSCPGILGSDTKFTSSATAADTLGAAADSPPPGTDSGGTEGADPPAGGAVPVTGMLECDGAVVPSSERGDGGTLGAVTLGGGGVTTDGCACVAADALRALFLGEGKPNIGAVLSPSVGPRC